MNAVTTQASTALAPSTASAGSLLMDMAAMERLERIADLMASGKTTVPQHLRGSKGDCFAIALQSMQWGMNPFAVGQKTHLVNGTLGYEAQLVAAVINNSGLVKDRFQFEWYGPWERVIGKFDIKRGDKGDYRAPAWTMADEEGCGVRIWATLKGESNPRILELLLAQARTRNSTLWADDPKQQLAYLAQKRWARLYAPDVILGVYTADELTSPVEMHMGPVEEVSGGVKGGRNELPLYDQAKFNHNVSKWAKTVVDGLRTAEDVLVWLRAKATVSEEQEAQLMDEIKKLSPVDVATKEVPSATPAQSDAPEINPEKLAADMQACTNLDKLYELMTLAEAITDPAQSQRISEIFDARVAELEQA